MNSKRVVAGILASLAGGVAFGILMQMTGAMPMIGMMVKSDAIAVAWLVHLVISAVFGLGWLAVAGAHGSLPRGLVYGAAVWVFGPLLVMPLIMGMPVFMINDMTKMSLLGHLLYGVVTALSFRLLSSGAETNAKGAARTAASR